MENEINGYSQESNDQVKPNKQPYSDSFWHDVKSKIFEKSSDIKEKLVDMYAGKEIDSRVSLASSAVSSLQDLNEKLKKIKPDNVQYDLHGKEVSATYSKQKVEERKKIVDRIEKIEESLSEAFEKRNFDKLKKVKMKLEDKDDESSS